MLGRIWTFFFIGAFAAAVGRTFAGQTEVWAAMVGSTFDMAKTAFEIALGLTGVMCLWLGVMRIGHGTAAGLDPHSQRGVDRTSTYRTHSSLIDLL